jgi:signal transduction histidine kinase
VFFGNAIKIWIAYLFVVLLATGLLAWFSITAIQLDERAEQNRQEVVRAEQEAAQQERVSRALWRMEGVLFPLVAQEAARTHWMYQAFLPSQQSKEPVKRQSSFKGGEPPKQPSPLLMQSSPCVQLHFQITEDGRITSPQVPNDKDLKQASNLGVSRKDLVKNRNLLTQISESFTFEPLWELCSTGVLPQGEVNLAWAPLTVGGPPGIGNAVGMGSLRPSGPQQVPSQQITSQQSRAPGFLDVSPQVSMQQQAEVPSVRGDRQQSADFSQRGQVLNSFAAGSWWNLNKLSNAPALSESVAEGTLRSLWFEDQLLLIRRVSTEKGRLVQGCLLDWPLIRSWLLNEIADIIPGGDLEPFRDDSNSTRPALATLPVNLVAPMIAPIETLNTGARRDVWPLLLMTWIGFILAAGCIGWLIGGLLHLSARRAAFASAVTHELRTPLTTFRLYSEMLASGIVSDPQQRSIYLAELVKESGRISRLVDNVLQFARLERKHTVTHLEKIRVGDLLASTLERCRSRVANGKLTLDDSIAPEVESMFLCTNIGSVDQIVFNLVDNACKYAAESEPSRIQVDLTLQGNWLVIGVRDFGPGIPAKVQKNLFKPFARSSDETAGTAAGVGLGLALSKQLAKQIRGRVEYCPLEQGSCFQLRLPIQEG